jgi:hypothetical protein
LQEGEAKKLRETPENNSKNSKTFFQKPIDKCTEMWYTITRRQDHRFPPSGCQKDVKKNLKNFEKTFQKPLDKIETMCYNKQVVRNATHSGA